MSEKKAPIVRKLGEADYTRNRDRKMHIVVPGTSTTLLPEGPLRRVRGVDQRKHKRYETVTELVGMKIHSPV